MTRNKTPNMTRKDFELIARTIKAQREEIEDRLATLRAHALAGADQIAEGNSLTARQGELLITAQRFASALSATNPRFDRGRFLQACTPSHYA